MKKLIFSILCLGFVLSASAQKEETFFNKNGLRFSGAWGGWHNGITSFEDDYSVMVGGFGGLEFGKNLFVGYAGYHTSDEVKFGIENTEKLNMFYNGLLVNYGHRAHKVVHPTFEMLIGGGSIKLTDIDNLESKQNMLVIQPAVGAEFNIARWFRIGINAGYRFVNGAEFDSYTDTDFSQPYGELRFKFGFSWGDSSKNDNTND